MHEREAVVAYLPRLLLDGVPASGWVERAGTMLFSDVSGFTALSEKLARHGNAGAEEMVGAISSVFTPLLDEVAAHGGDVLKFGGDALLTFFSGDAHTARAASCAQRMRRVLRSQGRVRTEFGEVRLGMSQGLHSGRFFLAVCGSSYAEVVTTGTATTTTLAMESAAERGEVLVSAAAAAQLPASTLRPGHDGGLLLRTASPLQGRPVPAPRVTAEPGAHLDRFVPLALRGRLGELVGESEHRLVTVAFAQFTGCDAVLAAHGPGELHRRLTALVDTVTRAAAEHDVTVICVDVGADGGKVMLASGAPDGNEDDALLMLRCARAVLDAEPPLPVRIGVNRGRVYAGRVGGADRWTYSTMGDPVNLAARVMGKATPGSVLATAAVLDAAGPAVAHEPVPPFAVKGKAALVSAGVVVGVRAARHSSGVGFVGRRAEVAALDAAWQAVTRRRAGGVVEVVAPPGTGKSTLVEQLAAGVPPSRVLAVAGERYHRGTAYFAAGLLLRKALGISDSADADAAGAALTAWVRRAAPALRPWLPLLAVAARAHAAATPESDAVAPEFRAARTAAVVTELLTVALAEPTLLWFEDAHWYDDASARVLAHLLEVTPGRPWLAVVSRRPEPVGLHDGLGYGARRVDLAPLSADEAVALVRAAAGQPLTGAEARGIAAAAAANPLFVIQMARAWMPGTAVLPDRVEAVIAARIDRLAPRERRVLRAAAVLGSYVDAATLTRICDEPLDDAVWARLSDHLAPDVPGRFRFTHDLVRTVAYESLPYRRRRDYHARAAAALEAQGQHDERAALLSLHFEAAGDHVRTWLHARRAAVAAHEACALDEAAQLYARALRASRRCQVGAEDVAAVADALGDVEEMRGRFDAAYAAYRVARAQTSDRARALRLCHKQGITRERQARYGAALRWFSRGLAAAAAGEDEAVRAMLLLDVAGTRYRQGRFRDAVRAARAALRAAEDAGDDREIAHACFLLDAALTDLGDPSGAVFRERALPVYRRLGDLVGEANVHNNIGIDAYYEGRLPDALASYRRSLSCRTRAGDVIGAATAENNIGEVLSDLGRFDEALSRFEEALAVWTRAGYAVGIALASSNLARLHVRRGALDAARPLLDTAETVFRDIGSRVLLFETRVRRCELALAAGDDAVALRLVTELQAQAGSVALSPVVAAALARAHGTALLRAGEVARGRALLAEAADAFARTGLRWDHDETLRVLADAGPVALPAQREVAQVAQPTPTAVTGTAVVDLTDPVADRA